IGDRCRNGGARRAALDSPTPWGAARMMRPWLTRASRFAFAAVPLLGLAELAAHFFFAERPPAFGDWFVLRDVVAAERRPGDLVVVAPEWADPVARRALGDALMPMRDEARPDVTRYASALEIGILGAHAHELSGWREIERREHGKFVVRRLEN